MPLAPLTRRRNVNLWTVLGGAGADHYRDVDHPSTKRLCPHERTLGAREVLVGHQACLGHGGGPHGPTAHATKRCTGHPSTPTRHASMGRRPCGSPTSPRSTGAGRPNLLLGRSSKETYPEHYVQPFEPDVVQVPRHYQQHHYRSRRRDPMRGPEGSRTSSEIVAKMWPRGAHEDGQQT
jgi:hypothetical protein